MREKTTWLIFTYRLKYACADDYIITLTLIDCGERINQSMTVLFFRGAHKLTRKFNARIVESNHSPFEKFE